MTESFKVLSKNPEHHCTNFGAKGHNYNILTSIKIPAALRTTIYSCVNPVLSIPIHSSMPSLVSSETTTQCDDTGSLTEKYLSQESLARQDIYYRNSAPGGHISNLDLKTSSLTSIDQMSIKYTKIIAKRNYILSELVSTEKVFVSFLNILEKEYLDKLVGCTNGLYESLKAMRCYTRELRKNHSQILAKVKMLLETQYDGSINPLVLCADIAEFLSSKVIAVYYYQNYIHNYYITLAALQKVGSKDKKFSKELVNKVDSGSLALEKQYKKFLLQDLAAKKGLVKADASRNSEIFGVIKNKQTSNKRSLYEGFQILQKEMFASSGANASLKVDLSFKSLIQSPVSRISKYRIFLQQILALFCGDVEVAMCLKSQENFVKIEKGLSVLSKKLEEINNFDNTAAPSNEALHKEPLHSFISTHLPFFTLSGRRRGAILPIETLGQCHLSGPCIALWITKQSDYCPQCATEKTNKNHVKVTVIYSKKDRSAGCTHYKKYAFRHSTRATLTGKASYLFLFNSHLLIAQPYTDQDQLTVLFSIPLHTSTIVSGNKLEKLLSENPESLRGLHTDYEHRFKIQFKIKNKNYELVLAFYNKIEHCIWEEKLLLLIDEAQDSCLDRLTMSSAQNSCLKKMPPNYLCTVVPKNICPMTMLKDRLTTKGCLKSWFHLFKCGGANELSKPVFFTILFTRGKALEVWELPSRDVSPHVSSASISSSANSASISKNFSSVVCVDLQTRLFMQQKFKSIWNHDFPMLTSAPSILGNQFESKQCCPINELVESIGTWELPSLKSHSSRF